MATHAFTVAPGWLEIEAGAEHRREHDRSAGTSMPLTAKIGVASRLQLSITASLERSQSDGISVGLKWRIADHVPVAGSFALLPSVTVSTDTSGPSTVGLTLISSRELGPVGLDLNVAYARTGGKMYETLWAAAAGGAIAGRLGWSGELYGSPRVGGTNAREAIVAALVGPTIAARPWLVFDAGVVVPIIGPQPRAVYAGAVWNAGRLWRPRR